jgi:hypothetical protein
MLCELIILNVEMMNMYQSMNGCQFNKLYNGPFVKFLNDDFKHYDMTYSLGLNIDVIAFNPKGTCEIGGIYFCDIDHAYYYYENYGSIFAYVEIPDDANVYIEMNKYKANKIIIKSIHEILKIKQQIMKKKNENMKYYPIKNNNI